MRNAKLPLAVFLAVGVTRQADRQTLILGALVLVLTYGFIAVYNDITDVAADRLNGRSLPLATGELTERDALILLVFLLASISTLLVFWSSTPAALCVAGVSAVGFAYSAPGLRLSDRGFVGAAVLASAYVATPLVLATTLTNGSLLRSAGIALVALPFAVATSLYKDFGDEKGDESIGKATPLVRYGDRVVLEVAIRLQLIGLAAAALLAILTEHHFGWWLPLGLGSLGLSLALRIRMRPNLVQLHRFMTTGTVVALAVFMA
ncbi:MAG: UbiA family prenyltransferase [Acidimicrobiales bacterium]|nr:UbiA family prenyltransferase [Acidimicrobiales bacterium]